MLHKFRRDKFSLFLVCVFVVAAVLAIARTRHADPEEAVEAGIPPTSFMNDILATLSSGVTPTEDKEIETAKILGIDSIETRSAPHVSHEKIQVLESILTTMNDNDPRMDTVLRNFSDAEKQILISKYHELAPELLNHRGTLVFLMGRELSRLEDIKFLSEVLKSEPCRSLGRCSEETKGGDHRQPDGDIGTDMTLIYPQLVALHSYETHLRKSDLPSELRKSIIRELEDLQRSPHPRIANRASEILTKPNQ